MERQKTTPPQVGSELARLRAQVDALRDERDAFRLLIENAKEILLRFRLRPTRICEYVSPSVETVLGYPPVEFYKDPDFVHTLVIPEDAEALIGRRHDRQKGKSVPQPVVTRYTHKDGHVVWLENTTVPIHGENGDVVALECVSRDVTKRVLAEEKTRESEEALPTAGRER